MFEECCELCVCVYNLNLVVLIVENGFIDGVFKEIDVNFSVYGLIKICVYGDSCENCMIYFE